MTTKIKIGPYTAREMAEAASRIARGQGTNNDYFKTGLTGVHVSQDSTYYADRFGQKLSASARRAYASGGPGPNVRTPSYRPITRGGGDGRVPTSRTGIRGRNTGRGTGIRRRNSPVGNGRRRYTGRRRINL